MDWTLNFLLSGAVLGTGFVLLARRLESRLTLASTEAREAVTTRIGAAFQDQQERLDRLAFLGRQELQQGLTQATQGLEARFRSLEAQVGLRLETIGQSVETKLGENLKEGFRHFEKVQEHLRAAETRLGALETVGQGISDLNQLLKLPHLRGGFGEAQLERLLADFLVAGTYELQYRIDPHSTERVDAVVKLARQVLPIDSKFPREQVLPLFESNDPGALADARRALSDFVREQARQVARKYIRPELGTTDLALLFLPSETLYFEVLRDTKVFEELSRLKVYPVSPNTLAIGLRSVTLAQEYYDLARGVEGTIDDVRKARRHFEHFEKRFEELGKNLRRAQEAFDTAQTHLGRYGTQVHRLVGDEAGQTPPESLPGPEAQA